MTFLQFVFYLFSTILVFAAAMVVTVRNPVKSALFLVLAFFSAACIWMILHAEFLAIVLVLVYVGAVMVLFLFVVMMLDIDLARLRAGFTRYLPVGGLVAVLLAIEIALALYIGFNTEPAQVGSALGPDISNTKILASVLYTEYVYALEIAALILLAAIIAAIVLTMRKRTDHKYSDPGHQVTVKREDRLKIIKMDSDQPQMVDSSK
ncbi:MAG: NADH-quinone oxidoreductase subunit J [Gammaproteobacteria bacterium]|nr:NADH-quinone oxidoreductase subunit J [Gammaproteobacteria bacterium]MCY4219290.1 NADH-quinone oxidoreductase subunit J [Gammaproteobacteria bacterium]MCY4276106.1 NADH-quinone oxidoreductase subunit J [Gammaproteobacteria bacterium]